MMESLEYHLRKRKIKFNASENRIRFEIYIHLSYLFLIYLFQVLSSYSQSCLQNCDSRHHKHQIYWRYRRRLWRLRAWCVLQRLYCYCSVTSQCSECHLLLNFIIIKRFVTAISKSSDFRDLHKFKLSEEDWNLLQDYEEILQVSSCFLLMRYVNIKILGSTCIPGYFEWWKHTYSLFFDSCLWIIH